MLTVKNVACITFTKWIKRWVCNMFDGLGVSDFKWFFFHRSEDTTVLGSYDN